MFGKKLRDLRGDAKIEDVAKAVGVSPSSWQKYERNERVPRDEVKVKIAKRFNKSVQDIFFSDR